MFVSDHKNAIYGSQGTNAYFTHALISEPITGSGKHTLEEFGDSDSIFVSANRNQEFTLIETGVEPHPQINKYLKNSESPTICNKWEWNHDQKDVLWDISRLSDNGFVWLESKDQIIALVDQYQTMKLCPGKNVISKEQLDKFSKARSLVNNKFE